jgi:uncharacterized NAD-dependent epimerase/dehydratase family protein
VVAVALNTGRLTGDLARAAISEAGGETSLPAADPIRDGAVGADLLAWALTSAADARRSSSR